MENKEKSTVASVIAKVLTYAALGIAGYFILKFLVAGIAVHMLLAWILGLIL